MILTLILLSIGALLFLVIAYNVVQQYKQKAEADKRQAIARHKAVADETEEALEAVAMAHEGEEPPHP